MNLDCIYEQYPEFERRHRRLNMFRMRHVDHLRPSHFKRELRAASCDLNSRWKAAVVKAEAILAKSSIRMAVSFAVLFKRKETDLLRPFGGKYPAISNDVDRSMANSSSTIDATAININTPNMMAAVDFDAMFAEMETPNNIPPHSLFADVNANGRQAHKTIVRTFFEMTHDNHSSHDRLQRVRGFTIGGKSWTRDNGEASQTVSPLTHFQLGNLFTSLVCYNNTHLPLAIAKCTLIKKGLPGSKSASVSAVPREELHLPASPYSISGQVLSMVPLTRDGNGSAFAWDGKFVSFSMKKNSSSTGEEIARLRNLQFAVPSRLIDCTIHEQAREVLAFDFDLPCEREKTWYFSNSHLLASWSRLWDTLLKDKTLHNKFPVFTGVSEGVFPYTTLHSPGDYSFQQFLSV